MSIVELAMNRREVELRKFINYWVDKSYQDISNHITFRRDFDDNVDATLENKIRAIFKGFEDAYEEKMEEINHLYRTIADLQAQQNL